MSPEEYYKEIFKKNKMVMRKHCIIGWMLRKVTYNIFPRIGGKETEKVIETARPNLSKIEKSKLENF